MESKTPPVIIPMWLTGFNQLMPEGRAFPYKYLPRPGAELSVTFGNPLPADAIRQALLQRGHLPVPTSHSGLVGSGIVKEESEQPRGWLAEELQRGLESRIKMTGEAQSSSVGSSVTVEELPRIRSHVTSIIHDAVENLGRSVSGRLLHTSRQK